MDSINEQMRSQLGMATLENGKKENLEVAMAHIRQLLNHVKALEALFPDRHFTLDGHLIGSLGEVVAAYHYGIELYSPSTKCHDGIVAGRRVQIKLAQTDYVLIGEKPDYLIVLYLAKAGDIYEVYNGPGSIPWEVAGKPDSHGYRHMRTNKLIKLKEEVPKSEKISARHSIAKLTPELKNCWLPNTGDKKQNCDSMPDMTDDEKLDIVAARILKEYKPAFEELAK